MVLARPDRIAATRFADIETIFDGKTMTTLGKTNNINLQMPFAGTVDHLVDVLQNKYNRPLLAADLLLTNALFRADDRCYRGQGSGQRRHRRHRVRPPFPCKYVITSKRVAGYPAYTIQFADWQTSVAPIEGAFAFKAPAGARQVSVEELKSTKDTNEFPSNFVLGGKQ